MVNDENARARSSTMEPAKPLRKPWWSFLQTEDWVVIGWVLAISVLIFVFGTKAYQVLANKRMPSFHGWLEIWSRWDADQYLRLAKSGVSDLSLGSSAIMWSPH